MKSASFTNFSDEPFTGYWNGKGKTFQPGEMLWMDDFLAQHYGKHLTNRELLKLGKERSTSPKRPEDVPEFMELFNQAYMPDTSGAEIDMPDSNDVEVRMDVANKNREAQIVEPPEDDEEEFDGKPTD